MYCMMVFETVTVPVASPSLIWPSSSQMQLILLVKILALPIAALLLFVTIYHQSSVKDDNLVGRQRSLSFNSAVMLSGPFPEHAGPNVPIINVFLRFESNPPLVNELALLIEHEMMRYDRFRCKFTKHKANWRTEDVGDVNVLSNHVTAVIVHDEEGMQAQLQWTISQDFPSYERPLWQCIILDNRGEGTSGLIFRCHHAIGDGISLVTALSTLLKDATTGQSYVLKIPDTGARNCCRSIITLIIQSIASFFQIILLSVSRFDSRTSFTHPDPRNLSTRGVVQKAVAFPTVKLDFIKALKAKAGCTVNDILLAATTGTLRRYCEHKNDPTLLQCGGNQQTRVLLPITFPRKPSEMMSNHQALRNKWIFLSAAIPIDNPTIPGRLKACNTTTDKLKQSPIAWVQLWLQNSLLPLVPQFFQRKFAYNVISRHSLVFSNVPGPPAALSLCDCKITSVRIMVPSILPVASIFSYNGYLYFTMTLDEILAENGSTLLPKLYLEELTAMAKYFDVLMDPQ